MRRFIVEKWEILLCCVLFLPIIISISIAVYTNYFYIGNINIGITFLICISPLFIFLFLILWAFKKTNCSKCGNLILAYEALRGLCPKCINNIINEFTEDKNEYKSENNKIKGEII